MIKMMIISVMAAAKLVGNCHFPIWIFVSACTSGDPNCDKTKAIKIKIRMSEKNHPRKAMIARPMMSAIMLLLLSIILLFCSF